MAIHTLFAEATSACTNILNHTSLPYLFLLLPLSALLGSIIYQLHFHPLSPYPGPLLGRITQLYDLYYTYQGDKHILLYRLHQQYGPVVRFTPNTLSINHPAALKAIYGYGANVQKNEFYKCFRSAPAAISTLLATEKPHHARKRRIMGQAFSETALRGLEQYVQLSVEELVRRIDEVVKDGEGEKGWSGRLDMQKWCNWLSFDIMGDLVFGKSFGTLGEKPENREGIRLLGRAARRNYSVAAMPSLVHSGIEKWIPPFRRLYSDRSQYLAFGHAQVKAKIQEQMDGLGATGRKDIFSFLLKAKDPETGEGLPMPELMMEGNTLIVAGSDTSSTTMAAILHSLLQNPSTLTRLEQEIRPKFAHPGDIRHGPELYSCTYLRACIDEAMRLAPAVPGLLPRAVLPGGLTIPTLDLHLPPGVNVGVCTYSIHHHPDYVSEPFLYDPARWLREDGSKEALQSVFNPFSQGNRACLGKPLVYMELSIAIARLVWEYDMRLSGEQKVEAKFVRQVGEGVRRDGEYHLEDWFLSNNYGPWAEFRKRGGESDGDSGVGDSM